MMECVNRGFNFQNLSIPVTVDRISTTVGCVNHGFQFKKKKNLPLSVDRISIEVECVNPGF